MPAGRVLPREHRNYTTGWFHSRQMDAKKKPTWSGHIRNSAAHQDQSSSSPLAQVRVDHGGFVPHLGMGNWADGTSLSPLDKHWGWPQRGTQVPIQAVAAGTVMPSTKRSSSEWCWVTQPQQDRAFWLADTVHLSFQMLTCSSEVQMLFREPVGCLYTRVFLSIF